MPPGSKRIPTYRFSSCSSGNGSSRSFPVYKSGRIGSLKENLSTFGLINRAIGLAISNSQSVWSAEIAEIDIHRALYGMSADEFKYLDELCPICNNRLDEFGWCGHGNIGGD